MQHATVDWFFSFVYVARRFPTRHLRKKKGSHKKGNHKKIWKRPCWVSCPFIPEVSHNKAATLMWLASWMAALSFQTGAREKLVIFRGRSDTFASLVWHAMDVVKHHYAELVEPSKVAKMFQQFCTEFHRKTLGLSLSLISFNLFLHFKRLH